MTTDLLFDPQRLFRWPVMLIVTYGRAEAQASSISELVTDALCGHRFHKDDEADPGLLKSPANADQVLDWIKVVWNKLAAAENPELLSTRHRILREIVDSSLVPEEQSRLLAALDYLFRLCSARNLARSSRSGAVAIIPPTGNPVMQAAYHRLAGLAATDLPVWLAGERGTELEWMARLVHRLRGLPDHTFYVGENGHGLSTALDGLLDDSGPDATIFVANVEEFPEAFQRKLYRRLIMELTSAVSFRIIVSSVIPEEVGSEVSGIFPDLSAFLGPMRIVVPPLRSRTTDIPGLVSFLAAKSRKSDPLTRFDPGALNALQGHHWPGNLDELSAVVSFVLKKRPSGMIRLQDLPDTIRPWTNASERLLDALETLMEDEGFRVLRQEDGRRRLSAFLSEHREKTFGANEIQSSFQLGRETARRLLQSLRIQGILEGITGATGRRVTRYRTVFRDSAS